MSIQTTRTEQVDYRWQARLDCSCNLNVPLTRMGFESEDAAQKALPAMAKQHLELERRYEALKAVKR